MQTQTCERQINISPVLAEAVVQLLIQDQKHQGRSKFDNEYHVFADLLYKHPEDSRPLVFDKLHQYFFSRWGCLDALREIFQNEGDIQQIAVKKAEGDEGCYRGQDGHSLLVSLKPERFLDSASLKRYLQFELKHLADINDPGFGYRVEEHPGRTSGVPETLVRERYRLLWDLTIDARIGRQGQEPFLSSEKRFLEFQSLFPNISAEHCRKVFDALWQVDSVTHGDLLQWAIEPLSLVKKLTPDLAVSSGPMPGARCPLCLFPTHGWISGSSLQGSPVSRAILVDFPDWRPEQGVCDRCFEFFELRIRPVPCDHPFSEV